MRDLSFLFISGDLRNILGRNNYAYTNRKNSKRLRRTCSRSRNISKEFFDWIGKENLWSIWVLKLWGLELSLLPRTSLS